MIIAAVLYPFSSTFMFKAQLQVIGKHNLHCFVILGPFHSWIVVGRFGALPSLIFARIATDHIVK